MCLLVSQGSSVYVSQILIILTGFTHALVGSCQYETSLTGISQYFSTCLSSLLSSLQQVSPGMFLWEWLGSKSRQAQLYRRICGNTQALFVSFSNIPLAKASPGGTQGPREGIQSYRSKGVDLERVSIGTSVYQMSFHFFPPF